MVSHQSGELPYPSRTYGGTVPIASARVSRIIARQAPGDPFGLEKIIDGKSLGFSLTRSSIWTSVTVLGMVLGIFTFGQLADRIGRKPVFVLYSVAASCTIFLYSRVTSPIELLWVGGLMGISLNHMAGVGALLSERIQRQHEQPLKIFCLTLAARLV